MRLSPKFGKMECFSWIWNEMHGPKMAWKQIHYYFFQCKKNTIKSKYSSMSYI